MNFKDCMDSHKGNCAGPVEPRLRPCDWQTFPRCERHAEAWYAEQERIERTYGGATDPMDFDPLYAGERWDADY